MYSNHGKFNHKREDGFTECKLSMGNKYVIFKGSKVRFSEVKKDIHYKDSKPVYIYASDQVVFDEEFRHRNNMALTAPIYSTPKPAIINLSGADYDGEPSAAGYYP
jgi:hypothetical protein